jgi:hypothetical protein
VSRRSLTERILRLYPKTWRDRYGDEIRDLTEELSERGEVSTPRLIAGLAKGALMQRVRSWRWSWRPLAASGSALAFAVTLAVVFTSAGPGHLSGSMVGLTKGTMPSSANGTINAKKVPDFIGAVGRDGKIVGYIPRAFLLPTRANQPLSSKVDDVAPVYASNLKTLVGHFYPGVGFVPLGQSPTSEPCTPAETFSQTADGQTTTRSIACSSTIETIPNIIGTSLPTAMGQLSSLSLTANIRYEHSRSVASGDVIAITPAPGSNVPARSVLHVVSSIGPALSGSTPPSTKAPTGILTVPNTIGQPQADACATLARSGLICAPRKASSASVGIGHVLSQAPGGGARMQAGSTVTVTASSGP